MSLTRQAAFYISEEMFEKVKRKANEQDKKISEVIRHLLWLWLQDKIDG